MITDAEIIELEQILEYEAILKARTDFYAFCQYMLPEFYKDSRPHLKLIATELQKLETKEYDRLLISMPPRSGKSLTVTLFGDWLLGKYNDKTIMRNAYGFDLVKDFSYASRLFIQSEKYKKVFPDVRLRDDRFAIDAWSLETSKRNVSFFGAGVNGSLTGKGCDLLAIVDDPFKDFNDMSPANCENVWRWYTSVHRSRIEKDCPELIVSTRWGKDDLIGQLLEKEPDKWKHIVIQALDKNDKSYCEEIYSTNKYLEIKATNDVYIWECEYQQNPIENAGLLYNESELKRFKKNEIINISLTKEREFTRIIGYCDVADMGSDYLVSILAKIHKNGNVYIFDVICTQAPIEKTEILVSNQIAYNNVDTIRIESNNGGRLFARNIINLSKGRCNTAITTIHNTQNKETRILTHSGEIKNKFYFLDKSEYDLGSDYDVFMKQVLNYNRNGKNKHDDAVDSLTGLNEMLTNKNIEILK